MNHKGLIVWMSLMELEACKTTVCLVLSTVSYDKWMQCFESGHRFLIFFVPWLTTREAEVPAAPLSWTICF